MRLKKFKIFILLIIVFPLAGDVLFSQSSDLAKFETAKALFKKGINHFNRMEYLAAAEFFRNAVERYPEYYSARDYLSRSYGLAGFMDAALQELTVMQDMYPDEPAISSRAETIVFRDSFPVDAPLLEGLILKETIGASGMRHYAFTKPADIAVDKSKNIYITSFESGKLVKLDPQGKAEFVTIPKLGGRLYGVDLQNDLIAVSDFKNDVVYLYNSDGKRQGFFGVQGSGEGQLNGPKGLCFGEKNYIYVADSGNNRIQKFSSDGSFVLRFGKRGNREGELISPSDIAFADGILYVSDTGNKRISVFDVFGNFLRHIEDENFTVPRGISVWGSNIIVSDELSGVLAYNTESKSKSWFKGRRIGKPAKPALGFSRLMASVFDRDGFMYGLDYDRESVMIFSPEQRQYSNLDMDIVSVDTAQFPTVAFYVNIRDRRGRPVVGLTPDNFTITEDNAVIRSKTIDYLKSRVPSVSAVMCVDRSLANRKNHKELSWFADFFLTKMHQNDSVKVANFTDSCWDGSRFDWSRRRILKTIGKEEYGRGKNIGKALYNAVTDLAPKLDRRAIILLTDGSVEGSSFSQYSARTIIGYSRAHFIPIYIISAGIPDASLTLIAEQTGGAVFRPGDMDEIGSIYDMVKNSEEYRYVLVYSTYKRDFFKGWWSNVKIDVDYRGMEGHQWGGYFVSE